MFVLHILRCSLVVICCVVLLPAQRPPVEEAWDLLAKGERDQAKRVLERIIHAKPGDADARLLLGSLLYEDGKLAESIGQLKEAVRLRPRWGDAHAALGQSLSKIGDSKAARGEFEKAIELDPKLAHARVDLALILIQDGESTAAAKHLDRAISLLGRDPEAAYPKYLRAKIHTEQEEIKKAETELAGAVALRPDFAEAWSDLGQARKALLNDKGAFEAFQRAVQLEPDNSVSQYRLGAEYLNLGKTAEAVRHLQEAYRLKPEDQSTLYSLQLALRQNGQPEQARQIKAKLTEVLRKIDEESQAAFTALRLNNEGAEMEKAGNLRGALEKYRTAVGLDPNHIGIRLNFAVALLRLGQWREGLAELRETARRDPANAAVKAALDDALKQAPAEFGGKR